MFYIQIVFLKILTLVFGLMFFLNQNILFAVCSGEMPILPSSFNENYIVGSLCSNLDSVQSSNNCMQEKKTFFKDILLIFKNNKNKSKKICKNNEKYLEEASIAFVRLKEIAPPNITCLDLYALIMQVFEMKNKIKFKKNNNFFQTKVELAKNSFNITFFENGNIYCMPDTHWKTGGENTIYSGFKIFPVDKIEEYVMSVPNKIRSINNKTNVNELLLIKLKLYKIFEMQKKIEKNNQGQLALALAEDASIEKKKYATAIFSKKLMGNAYDIFKNNGIKDQVVFKEEACRLVKALEHLQKYSEGLIHRDIKTQNILVDENKHSYIADFGLSTVVSDYIRESIGEIKGTEGMIAPEILMESLQTTALLRSFSSKVRAQKKLSIYKSDIFSLGLVFFYLKHGVDHPFIREHFVPLFKEITTKNSSIQDVINYIEKILTPSYEKLVNSLEVDSNNNQIDLTILKMINPDFNNRPGYVELIKFFCE
ncbi:MAG: protein kinase [Oligoflexia bacterium]|nr:protein kinase [Oligoflexia bacterium]